MKLPVKLFVCFLLLAAGYLLLATKPVLAQTNNPYLAPNTNADVPANLHTWTQNIMVEVMSAMTCQIAGINPVGQTNQCLGYDMQTGKIGYVKQNGGAIGALGGMIAVLYNPPIHTADYLNYLSRNFGLAKPAYAAGECKGGVGFCGIKPLMGIWIAFRNIVYLLFVVIFVVIGIAIMLRIKIDPRTVMSLENQIPKIIIGLLLVTFSFAIAGFMIDLMYVLVYLFVNVFVNIFADKNIIADGEVQRKIMSSQATMFGNNPIGFLNDMIGFKEIAGDTSGGVKDIINGLFQNSNPSNPNSVFFVSGVLSFFSGAWIKDILVNFISWIGMTLAFLIIAIAILFSMFRLWFSLIMAYVYILVDIALAPFFILSGMLPGGGPGFEGWIRDLAANLLAFPATIGMFLLGATFMYAFNDPSVQPFIPPLIGNLKGNLAPIGSFIGLGIILIAPQAVTMMKDVLKAPQFKYTAAIGQALGASGGVLKNTFQQGVGTLLALKKGTAPAGPGIGAVFQRLFR